MYFYDVAKIVYQLYFVFDQNISTAVPTASPSQNSGSQERSGRDVFRAFSYYPIECL